MEFFSPGHLIIVLIIALIVLGPKRLPDAGRALGESIRGFKTSISGGDDDAERPARTELPAQQAQQAAPAPHEAA